MTGFGIGAVGALTGRARLFLASPEDWMDGDRRGPTLALLSAEERRRFERFRVEPAARAFATGRALARTALSLHADVAPARWRLEPDEHGRPQIAAPASAPPLEFNLSHNDRLVACVVTAGTACGVDVEWLEREVDPLRIAGHSFGENEVEDLARLGGRPRQHRFFAYWTLKEAYLKARGRGIAMRLDSALFRFTPRGRGERIDVRFAERTGDRAGEWQLELYRGPGDQLVALALRRGDGPDLAVRLHRARPDEPAGRLEGFERVAAAPSAVGAGA